MVSSTKKPGDKNNLFAAWMVIAGGMLIAVLPHYFSFGLSEELRGLASLVGMIFFAWGVVQFIWHWREQLDRALGPLTLIVGVCIMLFSLLGNTLIGVIIGGFISVVGAILSLRK